MKLYSINILAFLFLLQFPLGSSNSSTDKPVKNSSHKESSIISLNNSVFSKKFVADKQDVKLEKLKVYFALIPADAKLKVKIQEVDNQTNLPGKDISSSEIFFSPIKKHAWNTLDLKALNINIPNKEFYLTLECVNCVSPDFNSDAYLTQSLALAVNKKVKSEFLLKQNGTEKWETVASEPMMMLSYSN